MLGCINHSVKPVTTLVWLLTLLWGPTVWKTEGISFKSCYQNVRHPQTIFCQRQSIDNVSAISDLPNDTTALNLSNNHLHFLPAKSFSFLPNLEELRLDQNHISSISGLAFQGLSSLRVLNLSNNVLKEFPQSAGKFLTKLVVLILSNNQFKSLCSQGFPHLFSLQKLDISFNPLKDGNMSCLTILESLDVLLAQGIGNKSFQSPFSFKPHLNRLDFSRNNLTTLPYNNPKRTINVTHMDLSWNRLSSPAAIAHLNPESLDLRNNLINVTQLLSDSSWAPNLQSISLSLQSNLSGYESLPTLCDALTARHVMALRLTDGQDFEPKGVFQACSSLFFLDLSQNNIQLPQLFTCDQPLEVLKTLKLDYNHIRDLHFCSDYKQQPKLPNLTSLNLKHNHIFFIPSGLFSGMPKLTTLNLAENNIGFINCSAFSELKHLEELVLFRNAIQVLYDATFQGLSNLKVLKLRNNRLRSLYNNTFGSLPSLCVLDLGGNSVEYIAPGTFQRLPKLTYLYLDRNQLKEVLRGMFFGLQKLQILDLVSNNLRFRDGASPPFQELSGLQTLKLQKQQPHGIRKIPGDLFLGLRSLKQLYLSSNKLYSLNSLPLLVLHNLTHLEMSDMCNGKARMPNTTFSSLLKLTTLVLENFGLTEIQKATFNIPSLWDLVLTNNMIQTVPSDIETFLPSLRFLDIRFNPLACTCANENFRHWAIFSSVHVILFYHIKCPPGMASSKKTQFLAHGQPAVCVNPTEFLAFITTTAVLIGVLGGALGYGKGRWYFLYGYYMLRIWLKEIQLRKTGLKKYRYDAFVSYSSQDGDWVFEQLVPQLERGDEEDDGGRPCQLCLHHRDFLPGQTIVSNIVEAVYTSRKTLCVVSPHYFNSEWCSMEVQVALYRLFDEHNDLLVLVFLEAPPTWALSAFHKLRQVVRRRTYLQWPSEPSQQKVFWARLRLSLQLPERHDAEDSCLL
ncbi:hypothetical protein GN956_G2885 [Arapaima gigas]